MKAHPFALPFALFFALAFPPSVDAVPALPGEGILVIDTSKFPPATPPAYGVRAGIAYEVVGDRLLGRLTGEITWDKTAPERVSIGLSGKMPVREVSAAGLLSWAVRQGGEIGGWRILDFEFEAAGGKEGGSRTFSALLDEELSSGAIELPIIARGDAAAFSGTVILKGSNEWRWVPVIEEGLARTASDADIQFLSTGPGRLAARLEPTGAALPDAAFKQATLRGTYDAIGSAMIFEFEGVAGVGKAGATLPFLEGAAALLDLPEGDGWHPEAPRQEGGAAGIALRFERTGQIPVRLRFVAKADSSDGWSRLNFRLPSCQIAKIEFDALPDNAEFFAGAGVVPMGTGTGQAVAWLPPGGLCDAGWRPGLPGDAARLFARSAAHIEIAVGPGIASQSSRFALRVLQGRIESLEFALSGDGEILAVSGTNVAGWKVEGEGESRRLLLELSRPVEREGEFLILSQMPVPGGEGAMSPLRLVPVAGDTTGSGLLRVRADGAMRFEIEQIEGLIQVAREEWGPEEKEGGQSQVFRFPDSDYRLLLKGRQVFPEVAVNQVTVCEAGISDRTLRSRIEMDVREAPLREWSIGLPDGYVVSSLSGTSVADFTVVAEGEGASRLRVVFSPPVEGRAVLDLHLEKNVGLAEGSGEDWQLPALRFADARSVRGFIGVLAAPGHRINAVTFDGLAETPLNFFPEQVPGLQLAFRQREASWSLSARIEPMARSIAADVFHLFLLHEGGVRATVVLNYFVVGAPVSEWTVELPEGAGNVSIDGQDIRSWRREENRALVTLERPRAGSATLLVTYEHPLPPGDATFSAGGVRPLGVEGERGYIQISSSLRARIEPVASPVLLPVEPDELPAELRLLTTAPTLAAFQYTSRPFSLDVTIGWFDGAESIPLSADFARLDTRISEDGQAVTEARYFVKNRGVAALRATLPRGAIFWDASVDGEAVNARIEGADLLLPLPPSSDPEAPAEVLLRFGTSSWFPWRISLAAPKLDAPLLATEWRATSDPGRVLVAGSSISLAAEPTLPRSAAEILSGGGAGVIFWIVAALSAGGIALRRAGWGSREGILSAVLFAVALVVSIGAALGVRDPVQPIADGLLLVGSVATAGQPVGIAVWNLPASVAMLSFPGVALCVAGGGLLAIGALRRSRRAIVAGWALAGIGLLPQHGGAPLLFAWISLGILLGPGRRIFADWRGAPVRPTAPLVLFAALALLVQGACTARALPPDAAMESLRQTIEIGPASLDADVDFRVRAVKGQAVLLLSAPGTLIEFSGAGLLLNKAEGESAGGEAYYAVAERDGIFSGRFRYRLGFPEGAREIRLPVAKAAVGELAVSGIGRGWEFSSPSAVLVSPDTGAEGSAARIVLGPSASPILLVSPLSRNPSAEELRYFVESSQVYVPGPGSVRCAARLLVRVALGETRSVEVVLPSGAVVERVSSPDFSEREMEWRFDPETGALRVELPSPVSAELRIDVLAQTSLGPLPCRVALEPMRVPGAADESGKIALAFPEDAMAAKVVDEGLSAINFEDFDASLLERAGGSPALYRVWRFGKEGGRLDVEVVPVEPEVRVDVAQVLSMGDERVSLSADITTDIRRAGVFRLAVRVPEGFDVESVAGESLGHWSEMAEGGQRKILLHFPSPTRGKNTFSLTFSAPPVAEAKGWDVPRVLVEGAARSGGSLVVVPSRGMRLRAAERESCSPMEGGEMRAMQPGALAFRLLRGDWRLLLDVEMLDAWVTASVLHSARLREGLISHRVAFRYRIEHAPVRSVRVAIPGLDEEAAKSVRFEGEAVAGAAPVAGENDLWEISFRRGLLGDVGLLLEFQQRVGQGAGDIILRPARPEGVRQAVVFVAVRSSGRIEFTPGELPATWQRVGWEGVPPVLVDAFDPDIPPLVVRAGDASLALPVAFRRLELAASLKVRVSSAELTSNFSPDGASVTSARFEVGANGKTGMAVRLPEGASLGRVAVNGEEVAAARDGRSILFYVSPPPGGDGPAVVEVAYAMPGGGRERLAVRIEGPVLAVPVENARWRVRLPQGWEMTGHSGTMILDSTGSGSNFGKEEYLAIVAGRRAGRIDAAGRLIEQAGQFLREGDAERARSALVLAAKASGVDEATNEDARVQLRNIASRQAVLGLNTMRQKMYLDNRPEDAAANESLERAARENPILRGGQANLGNFDRLMEGTSPEEAGVLSRVAERIVGQELAAEPAPRAVSFVLPEWGEEAHFLRSVQTDGDRPLEVGITMRRKSGARWGGVLALAGGIALMAAWVAGGKRRG